VREVDVHRAVTRHQALIGRLAETAGRVLNRVAAKAGTVPGVLGAGLVSYGCGQIYRPLLFIAGGAFLLLIDNRTRT
jgi:hypothetical protein